MMTSLKIYDAKNFSICSEHTDFADISKQLADIDIVIERWRSNSEQTPAAILDTYKNEVAKIMREHNFKGVDVMELDHEKIGDSLDPLRAKFLDEHIHTDDEVRYFIDGLGLFCVHVNDRVYSILCTAGDLISVPANTKHWFDMGSKPSFKCIRFYSGEEGWVPKYTENDGGKISRQFPNLDTILGAIRA